MNTSTSTTYNALAAIAALSREIAEMSPGRDAGRFEVDIGSWSIYCALGALCREEDGAADATDEYVRGMAALGRHTLPPRRMADAVEKAAKSLSTARTPVVASTMWGALPQHVISEAEKIARRMSVTNVQKTAPRIPDAVKTLTAILREPLRTSVSVSGPTMDKMLDRAERSINGMAAFHLAIGDAIAAAIAYKSTPALVSLVEKHRPDTYDADEGFVPLHERGSAAGLAAAENERQESENDAIFSDSHRWE